MKKNLMSVLILALVVVNMVLTAILTISVLPQTKKANELITQVCAAINLELESGEVKDASTIPIDQIDTYNLTEKLTINLKDSVITNPDGTTSTSGGHFFVALPVITMDKSNEGYKLYGAQEEMAAKETLIANVIITEVKKYTLEDIKADDGQLKQKIIKELQKLFNSDFIVDIGFSQETYQ